MVSSIGDEVWAVSLPVILAGTLKVNEIGQAYSFGAIGTLIGFFLSTWVGCSNQIGVRNIHLALKLTFKSFSPAPWTLARFTLLGR